VKLDPTAMGALMETVGQGNPMVKGVADLLMSALGDDDESQEKERQQRRERARERLRRIQRTIQAHARRNTFLAGALGACECWGEDPDCTSCRGQGKAGFFEPDPTAFKAIVAPLIASRRRALAARLEGGESRARHGASPFSEEET
jgi:hypothetical protein